MPRHTKKLPKADAVELMGIEEQPITQTDQAASLIPEHILRFLNALPMTSDTVEWINAFREALRELLGDVDRIAVSVDLNSGLSNSSSVLPDLAITQHMSADADTLSSIVTASEQGTYASPSEFHLQEFQRLGYPLGDYHDPYGVDYYYEGKVYVGTIFLFRERAKPPISDRTLIAMSALEPFLTFTLSDLVTRNSFVKPIDRIFYDILRDVANEAGLSVQDRRVLSLLVLGYPYKQVADRMDLSLDTIRKHMKRIYRKTRTGSLAELFAKYFTPRLGIQGLGEDDSL
ncbi:MAG: LuxR family transcriptional regulator [Chlorobi bacterium]|nr:LuxR family transcriptional regulator [Chlorobiota bacterium]